MRRNGNVLRLVPAPYELAVRASNRASGYPLGCPVAKTLLGQRAKSGYAAWPAPVLAATKAAPMTHADNPMQHNVARNGRPWNFRCSAPIAQVEIAHAKALATAEMTRS